MYISNINTSSLKFSSIENKALSIPHTKVTIDSFENTVLIYVLDGNAHIQHDKNHQTLSNHQMIIINPNQTCIVSTNDTCQLIILRASGYQFTSSTAINSNNMLFHITHLDKIILDYLKLALIESSSTTHGKQHLLKRITECILIHLLQNNDFSIKATDCEAHTHDINNIIHYIQTNFTNKITLEQLSELSAINKYYLIRIFKQYTGLSPIDYIIHIRIEEAEKLLIESSLPISKISDLVGFHSPSHFTKVFKAIHHMTPSQFRKHEQNI